jgi:hydrogenase expression/formation protein HypE
MNGDHSCGKVILAHGGGGELTRQLLAEHILPPLRNDLLDPLTDAAVLDAGDGRLCFTTDAYVVTPIEFPGADIGRLAVCGTVNDLAVMGAAPVALSLAMVLEEGLPFETLGRIIASIAQAASEAGVVVATGDTKVVERRNSATSAPGMTITTAGVGRLDRTLDLSPGRVEPGDAVLINGPVAEHGLAVMSAREDLSFQTEIRSDAAPLAGLIAATLDSGADVKFLRDPTRGGLAGLLADLSEDTSLSVEITETALPLTPPCRSAADMLGLDPLTVANEGKVVAVVASGDAQAALQAMRNHPLGTKAAIIGQVTPSDPPLVELVTRVGGRRIVSRPYGEDLPRIC